METTFALTCFVWPRSKLPHEIVSIMLRINMFRSSVNTALVNLPSDAKRTKMQLDCITVLYDKQIVRL